MVERRNGGEHGVAAVTYYDGPAIWRARDDGLWSAELMEAAGTFINRQPDKAYEEYDGAALVLVEYSDSFRLAMLCLPGVILPDDGQGQEGDDGAGGHCAYAARYRKESSEATGVHGCEFFLQPSGVHAHFSYLCLNVQQLFLSGVAPYPVERTLLTTGIVDAVMESRLQGGSTRVPTPDLANVAYTSWSDDAPPFRPSTERPCGLSLDVRQPDDVWNRGGSRWATSTSTQ